MSDCKLKLVYACDNKSKADNIDCKLFLIYANDTIKLWLIQVIVRYTCLW